MPLPCDYNLLSSNKGDITDLTRYNSIQVGTHSRILTGDQAQSRPGSAYRRSLEPINTFGLPILFRPEPYNVLN